MKPTTPDYVDWKALTLVDDGGMARYRGAYLDGGLPLPWYLHPELTFAALLAEALLTMGPPDEHSPGFSGGRNTDGTVTARCGLTFAPQQPQLFSNARR